MANKVSYFDVSKLNKDRLLVFKEASPLPDLLRMAFSEEELEIYQMHRSKMSLSKIGEALEQPRAKIYKKLCTIKSNIRFLLMVKKAIKTLPRLIEDLCPPHCPFRDKEE